jgi:hypothetical protein
MVAGGAYAAPRGFTVEDMVNMERVGSPVLSPDATRVVYTVRATDLGKNRSAAFDPCRDQQHRS